MTSGAETLTRPASEGKRVISSPPGEAHQHAGESGEQHGHEAEAGIETTDGDMAMLVFLTEAMELHGELGVPPATRASALRHRAR